MTSPFRKFAFCSALFAAFVILPCRAETPAAANVSASQSGLSALAQADGSYQLASQNPAWTFSGSLNVALKKIKKSRGHDDLGDYQQISFDWQSGQMPMSGWIRIYDEKPLALFSQTCGVKSEMPPAAFPAFTKFPRTHIFSYGQSTFAPPKFAASDASTPWLLFDDAADAVIISPASHFMVASMTGDGKTEIASGFNRNLRNVPANFTQRTLVAFGNGINKTWDLWGKSLLGLEHAKRPSNDADAVLKYLGYWTDNGAFYYYHYDLKKGYAGTLRSLVEHYRREQIPIRYLQLDSWWYYKTTTDADGKKGPEKKAKNLPSGEWNRYGGLLKYEAHPALFPNGLNHFQKSIGLPLVTHNRWIDPASPYHQKYKISGLAAVDIKWWNHIADYLKTSGVVTYEQDWLDRIYDYSPAFSSDAKTGETFLDDMSRACRQRGITLQYCMALPCYFLQGSRYENLTTIRVSEDRFNPKKWDHFLYTSRLADSMGIWPWTDVYMSAETNNILLSTLSAGPVGIGDEIGAEDKANLLRAVRADGVIVKPDAPIVPLDRSYIADAKKEAAPLIAGTYTDCDGIKTEYIFAFNRAKTPADEIQFTPAELGFNEPAYVYDYFSGEGKLLNGDAEFSAPLAENSSAFYVVAPVGKSGIAFLGDKNKFVGTGKQRIISLDDQPEKLTVGVALAKNEKSVTLHGFANAEPKVTALTGHADDLRYDPVTHYFTVAVHSDAASISDSSGDAVRKLTVIFQMPNGTGDSKQ